MAAAPAGAAPEPRPPVLVLGRVVLMGATPTAAVVSVRSEGEQDAPALPAIGPGGRFEATIALGPRYHVRVEAPGFSAIDRFGAVEGPVLDLGELWLGPPARIRGVLRGAAGAPVAGVTVTAETRGGPVPGTIDPEGRFVLPPIEAEPEISLRFETAEDGFQASWPAEPGADVDLDVKLRAPLRGTLRGLDGAPQGGIVVILMGLRGSDTWSPGRFAVANTGVESDGRFAFPLLPEARRLVVWGMTSRGGATFSGFQEVPTTSEEVDVVAPAAVVEGALAAPIEPGVSVQWVRLVYPETAEPGGGFELLVEKVRLYREAQRRPGGGWYRVGGGRGGRALVQAVATDGRLSRPAWAELRRGEVVPGPVLELPSPHEVGRILLHDRGLSERAVVAATDARSGALVGVWTGGDPGVRGDERWIALPAGRYVLRIARPERPPEIVEVEVRAGETVEVGG